MQQILDKCWEWPGARHPFGYGVVRVGGRCRRVHRVVYEIAVGPIPTDLVVRHKCDNPPCFNPAHLELGTKKDNTQDMMVRGRRKQGAVRTPKLLMPHKEQVAQLADDGVPILRIARLFGVSRQAVYAILRYMEK